MPSNAPSQLRLLIVDDQEIGRAGLRAILAGVDDFTIVGEAPNGIQAVRLGRQLRPDVLLLHLRRPFAAGFAALAQIRQALPNIKTVVVTRQDNPGYLLEALRLGVSGYIASDATRQQVIDAIRAARSGSSLLESSVARQLLARSSRGSETQSLHPYERLTPREQEVLEYLAQGMTNPGIARALGISNGTVKHHVEQIIGKLGVSDRTQAAVRALQLGLVSSPATEDSGSPYYSGFPT